MVLGRLRDLETCTEGGNLLSDGELCFVGADTVAENVARLGLTPDEMTRCLAAELGSEVLVLGDLARARWDSERAELSASGQPSFHLDLDVSLLGRFGSRRRPVALVADPTMGLRFLGCVFERRSFLAGQFLPPRKLRAILETEYRSCALARRSGLDDIIAKLEDRGYRTTAVPDLRLDPGTNVFGNVNRDFGFCNVLPCASKGRAAVYFLPWGIAKLDSSMEMILRGVGDEPLRLTTNPRVAHALAMARGGLHCCCVRLL